jgi:hypothetical protein
MDLFYIIKQVLFGFFFHFVLYEIMLKDISLATTKFLNFKAFSRFVVLDIEFRISNINMLVQSHIIYTQHQTYQNCSSMSPEEVLCIFEGLKIQDDCPDL